MERLYESFLAVNKGWRFAARTKSCSRRLVKNWFKWFRKMKISQNLCVQMTAEQFIYLDQVTTYPGMHLLCLSMRCRKICTQGYVFLWHRKVENSWNFDISRKWPGRFREASRRCRTCSRVYLSILEWFSVINEWSKNDEIFKTFMITRCHQWFVQCKISVARHVSRAVKGHLDGTGLRSR